MTKLPGNVGRGTGTGTGTGMGTPLFEIGYLGTSRVLSISTHTKIYKNKTCHSHTYAYLIFLNSMIHINIYIENLKQKIINLINHDIDSL